MRLGIFGGSFDPVHMGHLLMAECCREHCRLDRVRFIPTAVSPHKVETHPAPAAARLEMLKLAVQGHAAFEVSDEEIRRGGVSFTVDTLRRTHAALPEGELFFLMGSDTLAEFDSWKSPAEICQLAQLVVVSRPGSPPPNFEVLAPLVTRRRIEEMQAYQVRMPQIDISSTEIRGRVATGRSIRFQVPRAVEKYIEAQRLYLGESCEV